MEVLEDSIIIGYVHPHAVTEGFARSLAQACLWKDNMIVGVISAANPKQHVARNEVIKEFLKSPGEWLMWIDTDQTFEHAAMKELRDSAKNNDADMVTGLVFFLDRAANKVTPNTYTWIDEENSFMHILEFVSGHVYEVDSTGSGFALIHRRVFEAWDKPRWHQNWFEHPASGGEMGHDMAFFYQATQVDGFKLMWDTSIASGHIKHFELNEDSFRAYQETLK